VPEIGRSAVQPRPEPHVGVLPRPTALNQRPATARAGGCAAARPKTSARRYGQVASPVWAGTLTAFHAALTALNSVQLPGNWFLADCSVQNRYLG
jgi:hypothetical protein